MRGLPVIAADWTGWPRSSLAVLCPYVVLYLRPCTCTCKAHLSPSPPYTSSLIYCWDIESASDHPMMPASITLLLNFQTSFFPCCPQMWEVLPVNIQKATSLLQIPPNLSLLSRCLQKTWQRLGSWHTWTTAYHADQCSSHCPYAPLSVFMTGVSRDFQETNNK